MEKIFIKMCDTFSYHIENESIGLYDRGHLTVGYKIPEDIDIKKLSIALDNLYEYQSSFEFLKDVESKKEMKYIYKLYLQNKQKFEHILEEDMTSSIRFKGYCNHILKRNEMYFKNAESIRFANLDKRVIIIGDGSIKNQVVDFFTELGCTNLVYQVDEKTSIRDSLIIFLGKVDKISFDFLKGKRIDVNTLILHIYFEHEILKIGPMYFATDIQTKENKVVENIKQAQYDSYNTVPVFAGQLIQTLLLPDLPFIFSNSIRTLARDKINILYREINANVYTLDVNIHSYVLDI